ncbi:RNA-binding cell elongation regulator Jag/EloR [Proteiniclasticum sp.]|uniref:RNA-binding cell elongation regulator Jag/EloR n=1 Tax=Proteiniclasticum sp. TaxID=2053595 RepID=UPI00289E6778|nr:RNA-binding cell elongation regulator Jag/EloR [Proteiniclasticum sp.]
MNSMQFSGKNVDEALSNALRELNVTQDKITYEVIDEGAKGLLGLIGTKPAIIQVEMIPVERDLREDAVSFLKGIFENMGITAELDAVLEDNMMKVDISGPKMGLVIGYRGETLDSLQYLTSLVVNKRREGEYVRVVLDTEGYRLKREETLERLAEKTAYKVKKYRRPMKLEPMNPYERRIIHSKLQKIEGIVTHSVGDEPYRRVVIELDK